MRNTQRVLHIRIELENDLAKKFQRLMELRGLRNRSELVRQLIVEAHRRDREAARQ